MTHIIILAAGRGVRMKSDGPKVLTEVNGRALIEHLLEHIKPVCSRPTIVVGFKGEEVVERLGADRCNFVWQQEQLGTGHAVAAARKSVEPQHFDSIVVLYGDHPRVTEETVRQLVIAREKENATIAMGVITVPHFENEYATFYNFGRVVRDEAGNIAGIVEIKDATPEQKEVREVNPSYFCFEPKWLWENLARLRNDNKAGEYYLTHLVNIAFAHRKKIVTVSIDPMDGMGANTPEELEIVSRHL